MTFEYKKKIYGYECDIYGHLNNANYQFVYEAARGEMLEELGLPLSKLLEENIHIYVRKITLEYMKGIPFGSEIVVKSRIEKLNRVRSFWVQEIWSLSGVLMNRATLEGVFARNGKPFRIPYDMEDLLRNKCIESE